MIDFLARSLGAQTTGELIWILVGLGGQCMFMMRFVVQWIASEKAKASIIPIAFWYFSIAGATVLLSYAIYRGDPVFILGQSMGFFIYTRNLWLIQQAKKREQL